MSLPVLTLAIRYEHDVVLARSRAREIAALLGFETQDQTRIATAVSEIARNAYAYAGGGTVAYAVEGSLPAQVLAVTVTDRGPGIADVEAVLAGQFTSRTGLGLGMAGARRLMDELRVDSAPGKGTTVRLARRLPARTPAVAPAEAARIADAIAQHRPESAFEEVQRQNQELVRALDELERRQVQLARVNRELEETNRGVVALYAELDEKADHLRRANELKARFLSNMSHEFRTPVNSILALSQLLLERADGELTSEQEKQAQFIRRAGESLSELINDLLDIAKAEAGKLEVHPTEFRVAELFGALRGMLRPLLLSESVTLAFEEPADLPPLHTDEGKVSQILRNLISNALKFTERGEVRVAAAPDPGGRSVVFTVADTGIGIAPEDQERIFEEFSQVSGRARKGIRGTGLGLPISRKLAELLGGSLWVTSEPGVESTFHARIPVRFEGAAPAPDALPRAIQADPTRFPVLVIEDSVPTLFIYEKYLKGSGIQIIPAQTLGAAREVLGRMRPAAIVLDILLPGESTWDFLAELKTDPGRRDIPVVVTTVVEEQQKGLALGADDYCVKPVDRGWLLERLRALAAAGPVERVLVVDDDEMARYVLRSHLADTRYEVIEAADGIEGLRLAREARPQVIFLDLVMPLMSGFEVVERLKADPATRDIPVVILTSKILTEEERRQLDGACLAVLAKGIASRGEAVAQVRKALLRAIQASGPGAGGAAGG